MLAVKSSSVALSGVLALLTLLALSPTSCTTEEPTSSTYFDQTVAPILTNSCVRTNTGVGCHVADAKGNSLGNLDLSTFDGINKRRDLLYNHGPYGQPSILAKNVSPFQVTVQSFDGVQSVVTTDIRHSGGPILETTASGYDTIRRWIANGATQNNSGLVPVTIPRDPCVSAPPPTTLEGFPVTALGFDPTHDPTNDPGFSTFQSTVTPYLQTTCAAGNCHGTSTNVMYLLCGANPQELAWNFWVLSQYIPGGGAGGADAGLSPDSSQLLSRPLSGGTFHEGGDIFSGVNDPNYLMLKSWVEERGPASFTALEASSAFANVSFFAHRIEPVLVRKGCMMMQCHSPAMFHEYRLRGGTGGAFSFFTSVRNYTSSVLQLSLESSDVTASRLVRKNLFRPDNAGLPPETATDNGGGTSLSNACADAGNGGMMTGAGDSSTAPPKDAAPEAASGGAEAGSAEAGNAEAGSADAGDDTGMPITADAGGGGTATGTPLGITHRGGSLFEDFCLSEPSGAACDAAGYDYDNGNIDTIPAFCMVREWHRRERVARSLGSLTAIAYVSRPTAPASPDRAQDFDVFSGGASLHIVPAALTAANDVQVTGADTAFNLASCGIMGSADIRRPAVSWDGTKLAFAARTSAAQPLQIYEVNLATMACALHPLSTIMNPTCTPTQTGLLAHDFDPAYSPDGRLVFASTRGNLDAAQPNFDYCGPQRTPADPTKPNSNLYVYEPDPNNNGAPHIRQLTYLLNMERFPSFMSDGRLIFTAEKREPGFYQLAIRRINLDGGDYHPLYAQRGTIGAYEAIYPVEIADKDFAAVFSNPKSLHGGGDLVVFNRSIGIDFRSTNAADYVIDPSVINPASPTYLEDGTNGTPDFFLHSLDDQVAQPSTIYTSPAALPGGRILVSIAQGNPTSFSGAYSIAVVDPENPTAAPHTLFPSGVEAVAVYARANKGVFVSSPDEPNGHTQITSGTLAADITVLDMGVLASLVFQNTPTGRPIEDPLPSFDIYEELPADSATPAANFIATDSVGWTGQVFVKRRLLGTVPLASDRSAHFQIPGGVPIVLHLPNTPQSMAGNFPRYQREEMEFGPGEVLNEAIGGHPDAPAVGGAPAQENFFDGLCANCHGSVSGQQVDVAVRPDLLTQASMVVSRGATPTNLNIPPGMRAAPVGPPATP